MPPPGFSARDKVVPGGRGPLDFDPARAPGWGGIGQAFRRGQSASVGQLVAQLNAGPPAPPPPEPAHSSVEEFFQWYHGDPSPCDARRVQREHQCPRRVGFWEEDPLHNGVVGTETEGAREEDALGRVWERLLLKEREVWQRWNWAPKKPRSRKPWRWVLAGIGAAGAIGMLIAKGIKK